jgi:acetyl-CoA C-acetyltransferase
MKYLFSNSKALGRAVYIVAARRTPIGSFNGRLSSFHASELGEFAIKGALESINLNPKEIDEVILGNVLSAGVGQAPARQASVRGGVGIDVPCTTINKVCSSGLKSVCFGAQSIALDQSDLVLAGGFESMSRAPFILHGVSHLSPRLAKDSATATRNSTT